VEAFSDGVFAIAITLLILEIKVPKIEMHMTNSQLFTSLVNSANLKNATSMANTILHKAATRGHANHGWLESYHTFSFANYYNPERMNFGALRVLNDDRIDPGMGFGKHPHDNMEIISIPLSGDLEHKDSMCNVTVIKSGDIHVKSAGTGITHSEFNKNTDRVGKFLQIWVIPNQHNVKPRYDQITLNSEELHNKLYQIISPDIDDEGVWIHQNAWFHLGNFDKDSEVEYKVKLAGNGVYIFVINGQFTIENINLDTRDGLGITDTENFTIKSDSKDSEILLMEVPMKF